MAGDAPATVLTRHAGAGAQYRDQRVVQHRAAGLSATVLEQIVNFFTGTLIAECSLLSRARLQP